MCWTSLQKKPAGAATPLSDTGCGLSPPLLNEQAPGIGVGDAAGVGLAAGVGDATGVGVGVVPPQVVVVTVSDHPPLKVPTSRPASSTIYSEYVPFGAAPLKTASVEPYGPAGAGAGNVSPTIKLVGW